MFTIEEFINKCTNETLEVIIFDSEAYEYIHTGDITEIDMSLYGELVIDTWEFVDEKLEIVV